MGICKDPNAPGHFSYECDLLNGFFWSPGVQPGPIQRALAANAFLQQTFLNLGASRYAMQQPMCNNGEADCAGSELSVWGDMQAAAEENYDRTSECNFTAFVGYENTSTPLTVNWHRNVIFRNDVVVERPINSVDMTDIENPNPLLQTAEYYGGPTQDANKFWTLLEEQCLDAGNGCDMLSIPHNSNLGPELNLFVGTPFETFVPAMFANPETAEIAARRVRVEPIVEIYQDKGSSECRFDPRQNAGLDTNDPFCDFELLESESILDASGIGGSAGGVKPIEDNDPRTYVRNIFKSGLQVKEELGVNPFKMGVIAATDTHNGTGGWNPEDERFPGHLGIEDANPLETIQNSSGGVAGVWAEENSRDAIFSALKRKETWGTSGPRIDVRFFGSFHNSFKNACNSDFVKTGYKHGVPMGGTLAAPANGKTGSGPTFVVAAWADEFVGTPIQQLQVIKGWLDQDGTTHEAVYTVGGTPNNGATVDQQCNTVGEGADFICAEWQDPDFDEGQSAFYYVRVLENPVCRFSTKICQNDYGVNPLSASCEDQLAALQETDPANGRRAENCCLDKTTQPLVSPVIQERAWTSPIWFEPETTVVARAGYEAPDPEIPASAGRIQDIERSGAIQSEIVRSFE
jgi:hypothetical protein